MTELERRLQQARDRLVHWTRLGPYRIKRSSTPPLAYFDEPVEVPAIRTVGESADDAMRALVAAADQFVVTRGDGRTVIAGYHWFSDWGRDTMISEIFDGDPPYTPLGCIAQAWSVAALLRAASECGCIRVSRSRLARITQEGQSA